MNTARDTMIMLARDSDPAAARDCVKRMAKDEWPADGTDDATDPFTYSCTEDPASGVRVVKRSDGKNISFQRAQASSPEEAIRKAKEVWKLAGNEARDAVRRIARDGVRVDRQGDEWALTGTSKSGKKIAVRLDVEKFPTRADAEAEAREYERDAEGSEKDSARDAVRRLASAR